MRTIFHILFIILIIVVQLYGQIIFKKPLSSRTANYIIHAKLNTTKKQLQAKQSLIWFNYSGKIIKELQFHLYMNAFRDTASTFLKNLSTLHKRFGMFDKDKLGGIDIERILLKNTIDLTENIEFIFPDDGNVRDSTVIRIPLPYHILPGQKVELNINFRTRIPQIIARTGYSGDFFLIAQWYPKIGVLVNGEWNCHQFHTNSEFFSDFGTYDVTFSLPREFVVGASGIPVNTTYQDTLKTITFRAEDVHDFSLTAWSKFKQKVEKIEGVDVTLLYAPEHSGNIERYFAAISAALNYMNNWLMPYPYPNLTIVDPPIHAFRSGGMEYPAFITSGSIWGVPRSVKILPEEITIHEFCHQYFYGIIASNEFEEPWLDEGFTSFATQKILNKCYGFFQSYSSLFGIKYGMLDKHRSDYIDNPAISTVVKPSWDFSRSSYGSFVYDKPVLILQTLENYLGEEKMTQILREYIQRWKFRHPTTRDFLNIVNEISQENMDWFFDQALFSSEILDYSLSNIQNFLDTTNSYFHSQITVNKEGSFYFPVEIQIIFANQDTLLEKWSGQESTKIFKYKRKYKVISAMVDPFHKIMLDINWTNNGFVVQEYKMTLWQLSLKALQLFQNFIATTVLF